MNNISQTDFLFGILGNRLGIDPSELKKQVQSGNIGSIIKKLPPQDAETLQNILANKNTISQILCSKEVRDLLSQLNNLNGGK